MRRLSTCVALAAIVIPAAALAQSDDVIVMRRVIAPTHRTAGTPTPTPAPTPAPTPTPTPTPTPAPDDGQWVRCASESQQCDFVGTTTVRYGVDGAYAKQTFTNGAACSYQTFGDPAVGASKHCDYDARTAGPGQWVQCAAYGGDCVVPSKAVVRMGANGGYLKKTVVKSIPCTVDAFGGDPAYGLSKSCQYALLPDTPPTLPAGAVAGRVSSIVVQAGIASSCIQVAEVEVYSNGVNVALASNGGEASSNNSYSSLSTPDRANDGVRPSGYPAIFHSACSNGDYLRIEFPVPVRVDGVTIYGRADYGQDRDVYSYTLYDGATAVAQGQVDARSGSGSSTPQ